MANTTSCAGHSFSVPGICYRRQEAGRRKGSGVTKQKGYARATALFMHSVSSRKRNTTEAQDVTKPFDQHNPESRETPTASKKHGASKTDDGYTSAPPASKL